MDPTRNGIATKSTEKEMRRKELKSSEKELHRLYMHGLEMAKRGVAWKRNCVDQLCPISKGKALRWWERTAKE